MPYDQLNDIHGNLIKTKPTECFFGGGGGLESIKRVKAFTVYFKNC